MHKLQDKILEMKGWGSSRDNEGQPKSFCFCISIGEFYIGNDLFSRLSRGSIVRRTNSFYNKEIHVSAGESFVEFQMFAMGWLDMNYFFFSLFP